MSQDIKIKSHPKKIKYTKVEQIVGNYVYQKEETVDGFEMYYNVKRITEKEYYTSPIGKADLVYQRLSKNKSINED